MKNFRWVFTFFFVFCSFMLTASTLKPYGLMTDLLEHTDYTWQHGFATNLKVWQLDDENESFQFAAINSAQPTFSWIVPGEKNGTRQTAYQIIVARTYDDAMQAKGTVWNSGKIEKNESTNVLFNGEALQPNTTYFWRVKTTTNTDAESDWSDIKAFRTASSLLTYAASVYPQVKTTQYPVSLKQVSTRVSVADFGQDAFGQLKVTLSSALDQDSVIVHLGESLSGERIDRKPGGTIRYQYYTLPLMKGKHTYQIQFPKDKRNTGAAAILMPDYIGEVFPFRYCEIEGYAGELTMLDFVRDMVHYPLNDLAASFHSSNDTLNQIWELCKYSIKATSFAGVYVDGDRERIPYEADALINQLAHYGVDREYSMARRSHEYLLEHPTWPTEWILQAVIMAWNDYLYTGDSRSLKANYEVLKARTLMQLREKNGLISTTTGLITPEVLASLRFTGQIRDIVDWPHTGILGLNKQEGGEADGFVFTHYNAVTNAYHYEALKIMSHIAKTLQLSDQSISYAKEAEQFKKRFNNLFYNKKAGYYQDGTTTDHASLHSNMFPLAFGMVPASENQKVLDFVESRKMACSVYGSQFLMDALYNANAAEYALQMLTKTDDRSWYNMIRVGSTITLEAWDNKYKPNQDWNHAWGAAPANIIPRKLMGVEPLTPGFNVAQIKPQLGSLSWAKAVIPTIKGAIQMTVENKKDLYTLQLTIPANMDAEVYLPLPNGKYEVKKNNTLLKASKVQGEPFLYIGKLPSGTYSIELKSEKAN